MFLKLIAVPFLALAPTLFIVTILGTMYDTNELHHLLGGNSALPVWKASCAVIYGLMFANHFLKK